MKTFRIPEMVIAAESLDQVVCALQEAYTQFCSHNPNLDVAVARTLLFRQIIMKMESTIEVVK